MINEFKQISRKVNIVNEDAKLIIFVGFKDKNFLLQNHPLIWFLQTNCWFLDLEIIIFIAIPYSFFFTSRPLWYTNLHIFSLKIFCKIFLANKLCWEQFEEISGEPPKYISKFFSDEFTCLTSDFIFLSLATKYLISFRAAWSSLPSADIVL